MGRNFPQIVPWWCTSLYNYLSSIKAISIILNILIVDYSLSINLSLRKGKQFICGCLYYFYTFTTDRTVQWTVQIYGQCFHKANTKFPISRPRNSWDFLRFHWWTFKFPDNFLCPNSWVFSRLERWESQVTDCFPPDYEHRHSWYWHFCKFLITRK